MDRENSSGMFCSVRILDVPYHLDRAYDYYIPSEYKESARVGSFVSVPFGKGNRKVGAIITAVKESCDYDDVKPVSDVSGGDELISEEAAAICRFLCDYTLCTYGEAVRTVVPASAMTSVSEYYSVTGEEKKIEKLSEKALIFYSHIRVRGQVSAQSLKSNFGSEAATLAQSLVKLGLIKKEAKGAG